MPERSTSAVVRTLDKFPLIVAGIADRFTTNAGLRPSSPAAGDCLFSPVSVRYGIARTLQPQTLLLNLTVESHLRGSPHLPPGALRRRLQRPGHPAPR